MEKVIKKKLCHGEPCPLMQIIMQETQLMVVGSIDRWGSTYKGTLITPNSFPHWIIVKSHRYSFRSKRSPLILSSYSYSQNESSILEKDIYAQPFSLLNLQYYTFKKKKKIHFSFVTNDL